jgi:hypothetical protein
MQDSMDSYQTQDFEIEDNNLISSNERLFLEACTAGDIISIIYLINCGVQVDTLRNQGIFNAIAHDDLVQRQLYGDCRCLPDLLQNPHCVTPFSAQKAGGESSRVPRQPLESGLNP